MNKGKLEVVKQEMARVNINIVGISEPKWTRGKFNSDYSISTYCWQEYLRSNGVALIVNKRVQNAVLGCILINDRMICLFPRQTIQYHRNPSLCPDQWCWRSWMVLWRPRRPPEITPRKDVLFIIGEWNTKVGSQETPQVKGKFGLGSMVLYAWTSLDGQYKIKLILTFAAKDGEVLYSQEK